MKARTTLMATLRTLMVLGILVLFAGLLISSHCPNAEAVIKVKEGENFTITLKSNPTTGYSWNVYLHPEFVQMVSRKYIPDPPKDKHEVGTGGTEVFEFKALKKGYTLIDFKLYRQWMTSEGPLEQKTFAVHIE